MTLVQQSLQRVQAAVREVGGNRAFARVSGLPEAVVRSVMRTGANPTARTLHRLELAAASGHARKGGRGSRADHGDLARPNRLVSRSAGIRCAHATATKRT